MPTNDSKNVWRILTLRIISSGPIVHKENVRETRMISCKEILKGHDICMT
jgi:hypothetical protein